MLYCRKHLLSVKFRFVESVRKVHSYSWFLIFHKISKIFHNKLKFKRFFLFNILMSDFKQWNSWIDFYGRMNQIVWKVFSTKRFNLSKIMFQRLNKCFFNEWFWYKILQCFLWVYLDKRCYFDFSWLQLNSLKTVF